MCSSDLDDYKYHDAGTGTGDDTMFLLASETAKWWESPTAYFSVNLVSSMSIQLAIYSYGAGKVLIPGGVRRWNV